MNTSHKWHKTSNFGLISDLSRKTQFLEIQEYARHRIEMLYIRPPPNLNLFPNEPNFYINIYWLQNRNKLCISLGKIYVHIAYTPSLVSDGWPRSDKSATDSFRESFNYGDLHKKLAPYIKTEKIYPQIVDKAWGKTIWIIFVEIRNCLSLLTKLYCSYFSVIFY